MKSKEKLFQECMDEGKKYFYEHKNTRPNFMVFLQDMLKHFGDENSALIEGVYYSLVKNLTATKIFGFDSEQFKEKLNHLKGTEETDQIYDREKNKARELLKALNTYRSEYYYKIKEVYKGKADYDRLDEKAYVKKGSVKFGGYKEERLKYYTEGMNNNALIGIFSYEFVSNYSNIDKSESSYAKRIIDKIEEKIINYLSDIRKVYQDKLTPEPAEEIPEPIEETPKSTEMTPGPIKEKPEPIVETSEPIEDIFKPIEKNSEPVEKTTKPTEEEPKPIKEKPKLTEVKPKSTKVKPVSKSIPEKISITKEQIDIVRILGAMYSSGIIPSKTEVKQIAQLFFSKPDEIEKFVSDYDSQKKRILDGDSGSDSENLIRFIKSLSNQLKKFEIKEIIEHLLTISFDK